MGRFRSKLENSPPPALPEREPTQDELDEIEAEASECDDGPGTREEVIDEVPTEEAKALETRRRYGWG
jgi:hypothetical protein